MKATQAQQQALLTLLSRIYNEIRAIEENYNIRVSPVDFRPRIDYFHDVIREFTANTADGFEKLGRLSVESLAHDMALLRQIKEKPTLRHPELAIPLSPRTDVVPASMPATSNRMDVGAAGTLGEGYGHYALLFAALLAYPAERNFMNRINETEEMQDVIHDLIRDTLPRKVDVSFDEGAMLATVTDPVLRAKLQGKKGKKTAENFLNTLQEEKKELNAARGRLESAHLHFVSSQLVLYQEAPAIVKKMASQGLNIVGEFVASAVREAQRGGRGF